MEPRQAILVVSFGTSYNDSREKTIGAVERAVAEAFPAYEVRRAFTSQRIIDKLKKRDQRSIDNLKEALDRAAADGIKSLIVQPTHLMDGFEYMDVKAEVEANQGRFERLALGAPLLASEADLDAVIRAMAGELDGYDDGKTALCLMGHGTDAASNQVYQKMQDRMIAGGYANYYIGTVEAQPDLQAVIEKLGAQKHYQRAVLQPLMVVAGDHANQGRFERLALGAPLLASEADLDAVIRAMAGELDGYDDGKTALCLMGHGTDAASNQVYQKMQDRMIAGGYANYYIGTVEAQPDLQAVIEKLGAQKHYQRAVLQPLMVVAGDHANQDMAGEEEDSWKSRLERAGYQVECRIRGLGEVEAIRKLYVAHVREAEWEK